jgi:threonine/homoserine/homoserine lactone efflux protein
VIDSLYFFTINDEGMRSYPLIVYHGPHLTRVRLDTGVGESGSGLWWLILCGATDLTRSIINQKTMRAINYLSGTLIAGFGLYSVYSVL